MSANTCLIDGFGPLDVLRPSSPEELGELVRRAAGEQKAIYALGHEIGTNQGFLPTRPGIGVDLGGLNRVIDYPARDMTITVQTGITIGALQEVLGAENQRLPIDVPLAADTTLGEALAANYSGPRRYGFGTLRDYVIGISAVNDAGAEIKAGGRVVKNVAGYDLCKLFIGSHWTLGIMTQATLKVVPRPERSILVAVACPSGRLEDTLDLLHRSRTRPICLTALNQRAATMIWDPMDHELAQDTAGWLIFVGFEGNREAVNWQMQQLKKELSEDVAAVRAERCDSEAEPVWQALADFPADAHLPLSLKLTMLPRHVSAACAQLPSLLPMQVHAGNGILYVHAAPNSLEEAGKLTRSLLDMATAGQGNVTIHRCPIDWKASLPIWGAPRGDYALMRRIKKTLDPNGIFNPGRFVDGI